MEGRAEEAAERLEDDAEEAATRGRKQVREEEGQGDGMSTDGTGDGCQRCGDSGMTCLQCGRGYGGKTPCRCSIRGNEGAATDCECFIRRMTDSVDEVHPESTPLNPRTW